MYPIVTIKIIWHRYALLLLTIVADSNVWHTSSSNSVNSGIGSGNRQRAQETGERESERARVYIRADAWRRVCEAVLGKALGSPR